MEKQTGKYAEGNREQASSKGCVSALYNYLNKLHYSLVGVYTLAPIPHRIYFRISSLVWRSYLLGVAPVHRRGLCCPLSRLTVVAAFSALLPLVT